MESASEQDPGKELLRDGKKSGDSVGAADERCHPYLSRKAG